MKPQSSRTPGLFGRLRRRDEGQREVEKSEEEWRQLTRAQFGVLRRRGTEPVFSGQPVNADSEGVYRCVACDAGLFRADAQFDSGTGWPSCTDTDPEGVELHRDYRLGIPRTEVLCRRCGGHLGHVFNDGPGPERKRYGINPCALSPVDTEGA